MIIHLGMNPVNGGNPPNDNRVVNVIVTIIGVLFHICDKDSVVVDELVMNSINIVVVIRI